MSNSLGEAKAARPNARSPSPIRLAVVCDYLEERWLSMELMGEMVLGHLRRDHALEVEPTRIRPPFRRRVGRLPALGRLGVAFSADRLLNRFWDYPRRIAPLGRPGRFDLFHLVDHSYSQLVHALPADRTVVTCHDLDTFRCLFEPALEPRPRWFRAMARRILDGMRKAAAVACDSEATRDAILAHGLLPPDRLRVVYLAVHPECAPGPDPGADALVATLLGPADPDPEAPEILHVGSNIPRKRIDVLLGAFARIREATPRARLIKVGGAFHPDQARLADALGIADAIATPPLFSPSDSADRATLAAIYRRAALTLLTSDAEGFGMPLAESLACGTPVLVSDIPVLREVGGGAASYAPVGDLAAWSDAALALLVERRSDPAAWQGRREAGLAWADRYRWTTHVDRLVGLYRDVLDR